MKNTTLFVSSVVLGFASQTNEAFAERKTEIGGFIGLHIFNDDNELGVRDQANAESLGNAFTVGVRGAYALTGQLDVEGEVAIMPATSTQSNSDVVGVGWRVDLLYHLRDGKVRPFVLLGAGGLTSASDNGGPFSSDTDLATHGGIGAKFDIQDNWGVRVDARLLFPPSSANTFATVDGELFVGAYKTFGASPTSVSEPMDSDGDGISDPEDQCPMEPETMNGNLDDDGCPEDYTPLDSDSDGLTDDKDSCLNEAEDMDGFEDDDGCPDPDNDKDGVLDALDTCPNTAGNELGGVDGCPASDEDNDGVLDANDRCPEEMETKNGYEDEDGCADEIPAEVKRFSGAIRGIRFKSNSAKIRAISFRTLNRAVRVLTEFSQVNLEIQGHTDSSGDPAENHTLSQQRAQSVVDYLVSKGVDTSRLSAKGYGSEVSIADNRTKIGMKKNRRVEFKLVAK